MVEELIIYLSVSQVAISFSWAFNSMGPFVVYLFTPLIPILFFILIYSFTDSNACLHCTGIFAWLWFTSLVMVFLHCLWRQKFQFFLDCFPMLLWGPISLLSQHENRTPLRFVIDCTLMYIKDRMHRSHSVP